MRTFTSLALAAAVALAVSPLAAHAENSVSSTGTITPPTVAVEAAADTTPSLAREPSADATASTETAKPVAQAHKASGKKHEAKKHEAKAKSHANKKSHAPKTESGSTGTVGDEVTTH